MYWFWPSTAVVFLHCHGSDCLNSRGAVDVDWATDHVNGHKCYPPHPNLGKHTCICLTYDVYIYIDICISMIIIMIISIIVVSSCLDIYVFFSYL